MQEVIPMIVALDDGYVKRYDAGHKREPYGPGSDDWRDVQDG